MKIAGLTPRNYGLRVREHPGGLLVTAMNKMAHARTQSLSYAGQLVQTAHFLTTTKVVRDNVDLVGRFLDGLGGQKKARKTTPAWKWMNVTPAQLLDGLLNNFSVASECWRLQKPELMEFIRKQSVAGELTCWTVALIDTDGKAGKYQLSDCKAGIAERAPEEKTWDMETIPAVYATRNANIQSPSHQALDLEEMELDASTLNELLRKKAVIDGALLFTPDEAALLRRCCEELSTLAVAAEKLSSFRKPPKVAILSRTFTASSRLPALVRLTISAFSLTMYASRARAVFASYSVLALSISALYAISAASSAAFSADA